MDVGRARRRVGLAIAAGAAVLAAGGYAAFEVAGQVTQSASTTPRAAQTTRQAQRTPAGAPSATKAPAISPSAPTGPQTVPLTPVMAESFGPDGTADGDNAQLAPDVLTDPAAGWRTQWYATAEFGQLKQGTGLLLDMGRVVTIAGVTVRLGPQPGAVLELRGSRSQAADPGGFRMLSTVTATSGTATVALATPARARYLLLWCTRLPPDGAGTYQLSVHHVTVEGKP